MRSTASNGICPMSAYDAWPSSARPKFAMRRPLTSTRVLFGPRPRSDTPAPDAEKPLVNDGAIEPLLLAVICRTTSWIVCRPDAWMSSRVIVSIGAAVSASTRLMLVPVTLTRMSCATTEPPATSATPPTPSAIATFFR